MSPFDERNWVGAILTRDDQPHEPGATYIFDIETTGLDHRLDHIFAFAYSVIDPAAKGKFAPVHVPDRDIDYRRRLERIFTPGNRIIMHNAMFDMAFIISKYFPDAHWSCTIEDTMLMSKVLRNDHYSHSLDDLCFDLAHYPRIDADIKEKAKRLGGMQNIPVYEMSDYQRHDIRRTELLYRFFRRKLDQNPTLDAVYKREMETVRVTLDMMKHPIPIHGERIEKELERVEEEKRTLKNEIGKISPDLKPMSSHSIELFFQSIGFEPGRRTDTGKMVTDKQALSDAEEFLGEEEGNWTALRVLRLIRLFREYSHIESMLRSYLRLGGVCGKLWPTYRTCEAVTGRQSMSRPNLQNIQKRKGVNSVVEFDANRFFAVPEGHIGLFVDYSGIEARLIAMYSREPRLIRCMEEDRDLHEFATKMFFGVTPDDASWKELRSRAKNGNFAIAYGASPEKFAQTVGLDRTTAYRRYREYREEFPRFVGLSRRISQMAYQKGYVENLMGRRLYIPPFERHKAVNYLIQSHGADILKEAQIHLHQFFRTWAAEAGPMPPPRIFMTVHDEIRIFYPEDSLPLLPWFLDRMGQIVTAPSITPHLAVEVKAVTPSWAESCGTVVKLSQSSDEEEIRKFASSIELQKTASS